ncbi:porin [Bradyrhizobium archetypum]|uniref:Porin n=1 Tax=Bradyrhizobium archetypum TaxID=2721160 RepID=A0A7Y4HAT6_9BRAD|nr:porin [Bradyrhizobium archetypum]NOJ50831.1 porin [Bradyrhizobium archetypum]
MKMMKSLLLGAAAGLIAVSAARAADLPVKAKAVEYVKVCSLYGAGFYYIPGADTCIKLGGYLRVDVLANTNSDNTGNTSGAGAARNRFTNGYTWRSREDLNIDTRTATEYGVLRTFFDATFTWTTDTYAGNGTGATVYSPIGPSPFSSAPNNANAGANAFGTVGVYYAFMQFAGFTIGKAISEFSAPWTNYPGNSFDGLVGGGGAVTGTNQFTYTAQFGNGVSAAISAQDQTAYTQAGVNNISAGGAFGTSDYAGTIAPDLIGTITVNQAWGLFKASVAAHDNHAAYYGPTEVTGHPDDKWGWAGQLALSVNNVPTGPGDSINVSAVYTKGATRFNIQQDSQAAAMTIYGGTSLPGAYQSVGFGFAPDTVFAAGTQQQLTQTWGGRGAFNHNWDPNWSTSIYGAYAAVRYNSTAKGLICANATFAVATVITCNPDYNVAQAGIVTRWTPVKNLTFLADLTYTHLDQNFSGTVSVPSATIGKPAAAYELKDQNTLLLLLRAQRNW